MKKLSMISLCLCFMLFSLQPVLSQVAEKRDEKTKNNSKKKRGMELPSVEEALEDPTYLFGGLSIVSFISWLVFYTQAQTAGKDANGAESMSDYQNAVIRANTNTDLATYSLLTTGITAGAAAFYFVTGEKKTPDSLSTELEKTIKENKTNLLTITSERDVFKEKNETLKKEKEQLENEKEQLENEKKDLKSQLKNKPKIENVLELAIEPNTKHSDGVDIKVSSKSDVTRLNGGINIQLKKPLGLNVTGSAWDEDNFTKKIPCEELGKNRETNLATMYKMINFHVMYFDLTSGNIKKEYLKDTLQHRLTLMQKNEINDVSNCFLCISNGVDKKYCTIEKKDDIIKMFDIQIRESYIFFNEFPLLISQVQSATAKYNGRVNIAYNFFISRMHY